MTIRQATIDDAAALAELRWEFRAGPEMLHPGEASVEERGVFLERCAAWMREELAADRWRAWVAELDGRIVGQLWMNTIVKVPNPIGERERHAYLSNLYVTPSARGGTGTRLLETALAAAAASGVDRVVLWPSQGSRSLYRRYNFTPEGDVMELTCPAAHARPAQR